MKGCYKIGQGKMEMKYFSSILYMFCLFNIGIESETIIKMNSSKKQDFVELHNDKKV